MEPEDTFENTCIKPELFSDDDAEYVDEPDFVKTENRQVGALSKDWVYHAPSPSLKVPETHPKSTDIKIESEEPAKSKTRQKTFECQSCLKLFKTNKELLVHTRIHANERPFKCDVCEEAFKQRSALKDHQKTHTGELKYACKVCDNRFMANSSLKRHMASVHESEKQFPCPLCPEVFESKSQYWNHREVHFRALNISREETSTPGSCTCKVCGKKFARRAYLFMHLDVHSTPVSCQHCDKKFTYAALKVHCQKLHQVIECALCSKVFTSNKSKANHERLHFKLPSDTCDYCVQIFETGELLQEHMRDVHSSTIPCLFCPKVFRDNHLDSHVTFAHFKCFKCKLHFPKREEKVLHYKYKHLPYGKFKYTCKKCKAKFLTKSRLAYHMNSVHLIVTAFACIYCGEHFQRYRPLERHLLDNHRTFLRQKFQPQKSKPRRRRHEKPLNCEICCKKGGEGKYFKTKKLLESHIAKRHSKSDLKLLPESVQCERCDETFLNIHGLNMHLRAIHQSSSDDQDSARTCKECLISFLDPAMLREHYLAIHHPQLRETGNNYYCMRCPYKARCKRNFIFHMYWRHRTDLPDLVRCKLDLQLKPCPECNRKFESANKLKRHMILHQQVPELKCPLCGKLFNNRGRLFLHIKQKSCTTKATMNSCPYCPFQSKYNVLRHIYHQHRATLPEDVVQRFDNLKVSCLTCGRKFTCNSSLKIHMEVHLKSADLRCPRCGKEFMRRNGLSKHLNAGTCISSASAIKKYECAHCEELFTKKSELSFHFKSKHGASGSGKIVEETVKTEIVEEKIEVHEAKIKEESDKDEFFCYIEIKNETLAASD